MEFCDHVEKQLDYLVTARPTAVNMMDARNKLLRLMKSWMQDQSVTSDEAKRR